MNISVPSEWKVFVSLFTNKIVKLLSHVGNITVHSVGITWCKLTVWLTVTTECRRLHFLCLPCILSKVQMYTLLYMGYWLKETVLKCLNYWGYDWSLKLHPSAIVRPRLTTWSTIVALISSDMRLCPWPRLPLPLFCLCALPCILTHLFPLVCWPWSFSGCSSIVRICNCCVVLCLYMLQIEGSWDAPLSYFRELDYNWLIYILFIS